MDPDMFVNNLFRNGMDADSLRVDSNLLGGDLLDSGDDPISRELLGLGGGYGDQVQGLAGQGGMPGGVAHMGYHMGSDSGGGMPGGHGGKQNMVPVGAKRKAPSPSEGSSKQMGAGGTPRGDYEGMWQMSSGDNPYMNPHSQVDVMVSGDRSAKTRIAVSTNGEGGGVTWQQGMNPQMGGSMPTHMQRGPGNGMQQQHTMAHMQQQPPPPQQQQQQRSSSRQSPMGHPQQQMLMQQQQMQMQMQQQAMMQQQQIQQQQQLQMQQQPATMQQKQGLHQQMFAQQKVPQNVMKPGQQQLQRVPSHGGGDMNSAVPLGARNQGMPPGLQASPSNGALMSPQVQAVKGIFQKMQACQSSIVDAMQRSSSLLTLARSQWPEIAMQLQAHMPDSNLEAAHQAIIATNAELNAYVRMVSAGGSDKAPASPGPMGYGGGGASQQGALTGRTTPQEQQQHQGMAAQQRRGVPAWQLPPTGSPSPHPHSGMTSPQSSVQGQQVMPHAASAGPQVAMSPNMMGHAAMNQQGNSMMNQHKQGGQSPQPQPHLVANGAQSRRDERDDDLVIISQSGSFSSDLPHARAHCSTMPFRIVKDRLGVEGGQGNEQFCDNCFCYVCDTKASECQGWLRVGHCHANEKEPFWKALREFTRYDILCNSPLLQTIGCDELVQMEAHKSCINVLLAFHSYRSGDVGAGGVLEHSFQHVMDAASTVMKSIVQHLSDPKGSKTTLAVLDGITSALVINTWKPTPGQEAPKHRWSADTFEGYKAIIEQFEKYWILAIVRTSTRSVPPPALAVVASRLKDLSKLAQNQMGSEASSGTHVPLSHAISACERGWKHPVIVAILEGQCSDASQREALVLQRARLHLLEHAQRWKEAYHYALFHGRVAKSLIYLVRAGRHADVLPMVLGQSPLAADSKCLNVCQDLALVNQADSAIRLAMYCAFGNYEEEGGGAMRVQNRVPYVLWLVEQVVGKLDASERQSRNSYGSTSSQVDDARRDAEQWARSMVQDLESNFMHPLSDPPEGATYSTAMYNVERVPALCSIAMPRLAFSCAKHFSQLGDHCGAVSTIISSVTTVDDENIISWGIREILPKLRSAALVSAAEKWEVSELSYEGKMSVGSFFLALEDVDKAIRYATEANSDGAPTQDEMATANFDLPREFRQCNLDPFIEGAQSSGNSYAAIYLAELQLWWDPCWSNLQVLSSLCSEEQASMRRQQLQTLMINDSTCRLDVRFDVLVRGGMTEQAIAMLQSHVNQDADSGHHALKNGILLLGPDYFASDSGIALVDALWPLLQKVVVQSEGVDSAIEVLAQAIPKRVLALYDSNIDTWSGICQRSTVNTTSKATLRNWLLRTRRMYLAAGQTSDWDRRFKDIHASLKRKTSLSSIMSDLTPSGGTLSMPQTLEDGGGASGRVSAKGRRSGGGIRSHSMPSTPAISSTPGMF